MSVGRVRQGSVLVIVQRENSMKYIIDGAALIFNILAFLFFILLAVMAEYQGRFSLTLIFISLSLYPVIVELQNRTIKKLEKIINE